VIVIESVNPVSQERVVDRTAGKSPAAFRTIAEVAADLQLPAHVLRFWESKFPQIKPLKRRGGRRYYRPEDVILLRRIRSLLYTEGYTIKGVQRLLREGGARSDSSDDEGEDAATEGETFQAQGSGGSKRSAKTHLRAVLAELEELRELLRCRSA
jgi:DNA-binding transcriptional MerR regulator